MTNLELTIFAYLLNSLWQVPLLFAAGWIVARALRSLGARAEHRVWVIALILQGLVPVISLFPWKWSRILFAGWNASGRGAANVSIVMGSGMGVSERPGMLLATITALYAAVTAYFAVRFILRAANLAALRREAVPLPLRDEAADFWSRCAKNFAVQNASIAVSSRVFGPVTLGIRRKLVLLPGSVMAALPEDDLKTVLAHEFAHLRRHDFLKNLFYELLSLPVNYHPLLRRTRARIMESREMVCDQMAAAMTGPDEYAQSLLRLASLLIAGSLGRVPLTIGIFDVNVFERRLMNVTERHKEVRGMRRFVGLAACAAFGLATCASAISLGVQENPVRVSSDSASKSPTRLTVSPADMARQLLTRTVPVYPPKAKKARIQGKVVLSAVIGKDGAVENLRVLSGPPELQQSALDAVRHWTYKPYLLNGDPVEVETTVNIIYSLAG